ncbi:MAG: hypothetical protein JWN43_1330, partial [Gammaproteobacteria bacterium]|nr:hypothetical protein [Gammaproteobacteria bacterium]
MRDEIARLIRERKIVPRYQPIVDLRARRILAYEALVNGPVGHEYHDPLPLFAAAEQAGSLVDLELACLDVTMGGAAAAGVTERLFHNLSPTALLAAVDWPAELTRLCRRHGVDPTSCVLELTERSLVEDYDKIRATLARVRELGFDFAIDDLGTGYSGLRMWSELRPDFVKIDRYFVSNIESDPVKFEFVRSIVAMGRAVGSYIIAEGVETAEQCRELMDLDVDAAQGYLFAPPRSERVDEMRVLAHLAAMTRAEAATTAEQLVVAFAPLSPSMSVRDFVRLLHEQTQCDGFPVVDTSGAPLGMIYRNTFLLRYSKPLQPELLNKRPVTEVMDGAPLIIDARLRLEQVSQLVTRRSRIRLTDQFIIARDGLYLGIGQTIDLLERITQEKVRTATHSNPLTKLPGNLPITDNLKRLLGQDRSFVVCYVDLDNFKPFNDHYGYLKGDEVLLHVAKLLQASVVPQADFVGHLGGDDFVVIFRSPDWEARLQTLIQRFEASVQSFYSEEHRVMGGIDALDRYGERRWYAFLTMSIGIINTADEQFATAEEVSERLQHLKREAKSIVGNCLLVQRPGGFVNLLSPAPPEAARSRDNVLE